MNGIKRIEKTEEYLYDSVERREEHVELMKQKGWKDISGSTGRRVKDGVTRVTAKEKDYEWFACFIKSTKYQNTKYQTLDICKMCEDAELVNDEKVCASCNHPY